MSKIEEKISQVKDKIAATCERAGRNPSDINLVIVTKSAEIGQIKEVINLGFTEFGENRVQQLKKVVAQVDEYLEGSDNSGNIKWHMIGHLQRNKVRQVVPIACLIHSVDTLRLAEEVSAAAVKNGVKAKILLQVNTSKEPQKYGVPVGAATHLSEQIATLPNIQLCGLMTMAPLTHNKDVVRSCFVRARELFLEIQGERIAGPEFTELSMGMSSDYETAIEEGSTILRIGSAVFAG